MLRGPPFFSPQQLLESLCSLYWISAASVHRHWRWNSHPCAKPNENSFAQGTTVGPRRSRTPTWRHCSGHATAVSAVPQGLQHPLLRSSSPVCPRFLTKSLAGFLLLLQLPSKGIFSPRVGEHLPVFLASHPLHSVEGEGVLLNAVASPSMGT